jgi:hypothetical protein
MLNILLDTNPRTDKLEFKITVKLNCSLLYEGLEEQLVINPSLISVLIKDWKTEDKTLSHWKFTKWRTQHLPLYLEHRAVSSKAGTTFNPIINCTIS